MPTREKMFETNSSSSHVICVCSEKIEEPWNGMKNVVIKTGEYGWGIEILKWWERKASYAYTYAFNYGTKENIKTLEEVLEKHLGKNIKFDPPIEFHNSEIDKIDKIEYGYIDHQSVDEAATIFESSEMVEKVIFGIKSLIVIDNDNH